MFRKSISNWGNYPVINAAIEELSDVVKLQNWIKLQPEIIARGNGRCYGDSSLNHIIFSTLKLNKFLEFDVERGEISCESGLLFSEIIDVILPKGWFLPVTPGTKFITVGGAIAADVHGKNHHKEGIFSDYIIWIKLLLEDGNIIECSPNEKSELFWKTCGGMGLTGIIISAKFRLKKVQSAYIKQRAIKAANLEEIFTAFEKYQYYTYSVAWIDCYAKGKSTGKSILLLGEHAEINELPEKLQSRPLTPRKTIKLNIPFFFPALALNLLSIKIFNFLYYFKQLKKDSETVTSIESYFYPLDKINNWNRIYGKKGFTQYQFVIPKENALEAMRKILDLISTSGQGSFLAVLKLFGEESQHAKNSFPRKGYTLALDFKINATVMQLLSQLDEVVENYGGRLYLAKDVRMSPNFFQKTYPNFIQNKFFRSLQSKRLLQE